MQDLAAFIRKHRKELNLSEISRRSGLSDQYLKHIAAGRRPLTEGSEKAIRPVLEAMIENFPKG